MNGAFERVLGFGLVAVGVVGEAERVVDDAVARGGAPRSAELSNGFGEIARVESGDTGLIRNGGILSRRDELMLPICA